MTTAVNDTLDRFTISGTGPYAFSFRIFDDSDLTVTALESGEVDPVAFTLNSHYTVDGTNDPDGGTITLIGGAQTTYAGYTLDIRSNVAVEQPTSIKNQGAFLPVAHETAFDRQNRELQDLKRQVKQSFRYPDNVDLDAVMTNRSSWLSSYPFVNSSGVIEPSPGVSSVTLTQSVIGALLYPRTPAEIAASVTPVDYFYKPGVFERYGGSQSETAANNATYLTNALLTGHKVTFDKETGYYPLTGRIVAPANSWIHLDGCELRWAATAATGTNFLSVATRPGIEVTGNNFQLDGYGTITGPSTASYVSNECGIYMTGTSTSVRKSGFYVTGKIEFTKWGAYPILLQFVNKFDIRGAIIHNSGYIAVHLSSCNHGKVRKNEIYSMTPGTGSETFAISCSHDSTNYSLDANAATNGRLAVNPFCEDIDIDSNTIYDCPLWTGIDAHGGYELTVRHNKIYNCLRGIQVASGSGDAVNYAGEGNTICFNTITPRKRDGSATTVSGGEIYGITINGGSTVEHRGCKVIGNDIEGCGNTSQTSSPIMAQRVIGAVISGNTIRNWAGPGIFTANGDGIISNNTFGSVSNATAARCIRLDSGSRAWSVTGNKLLLNGGTAPAEGLRVTTTTVKHTISNNDFDAATTPYIGTAQSLSGAGAIDVVNEITYLTTTGANALTLANGIEGQEKWIIMVVDGGDGALTPTNLYNGTTLTFDNVGDSAYLKMMNGEWVFLGGTATLA